MPEIDKPGARLKALRKRLGVGQVEFSRALGVPQSNLSPWESGKREVPTPLLLAVCHVYGASQAWMLDGLGPMLEAERDLSGKSQIPDGGIYRKELAGVIQAIREHARGGWGYLMECLPGSRFRAIWNATDVPTFAELATVARRLKLPLTDLLVQPDGSPLAYDLSTVNPDQPIIPRKPGPLAGIDLEPGPSSAKESSDKKRPRPTSSRDADLKAIRVDLAAIREAIESLAQVIATLQTKADEEVPNLAQNPDKVGRKR